MFLRGTFDWVGTYPDFLHVGDYKTAINTYLEKGFTPAHREMSESLNRDQYAQLVRGIADGRKKREDDVRALIDDGPFQPEEALRDGLIDDVAYEDELDDVNPDLAGGRDIDADDYAQVSWESAGVTRRSTIAVINAVGVINSGRSGYDPMNGAVVGSDSLVEYIRDARANASVKAIVLRVDSPGGSSDGVGRDLAGAVDLAGEGPADHRLDVGPGGVGRLLHRPRRRGHRRGAGDAHGFHRRLHRQVRHQRDARQAGRQHRGHQQRQARGDELARPPVHARRSARRCRRRCRRSTTSSSSARPRPGT